MNQNKANIIILVMLIFSSCKCFSKSIEKNTFNFMVNPATSLFIKGFNGYIEWKPQNKTYSFELPIAIGFGVIFFEDANIFGTGIRFNKFVSDNYKGVYFKIGLDYYHVPSIKDKRYRETPEGYFVSDGYNEESLKLILGMFMWGYKFKSSTGKLIYDLGFGINYWHFRRHEYHTGIIDGYRGLIPGITFSVGFGI